jgi:ABC-type transport system involved in cytochrome c biogenesis permease subunit
MALKLTAQGMLIYLAMAAYLAAFVARVSGSRKTGARLHIVGFALAAAAFLYRWQDAGHVPLQNLFEVFLCLGMLSYPLSVFCRRFLGVGGESADALTGFVVLFPAGFVFQAEPQRLPPALQSWLFVPHVAAYMLAYVILIKASLQAIGQLLKREGRAGDRQVPYEAATYRTVRLGFPLLTLGLILGSWWGKLAWGDYWNWDPKELWSLAAWLVYVGYFHFRYVSRGRYPRANSAIAVCGSVVIVITLLWVNLAGRLFPGLHSYGM